MSIGRQTECLGCGESSQLISTSLPVCLNCIRTRFDEIETHLKNSHRKSRLRFNLPPDILGRGLRILVSSDIH
jgi:hypothetical protein